MHETEISELTSQLESIKLLATMGKEENSDLKSQLERAGKEKSDLMSQLEAIKKLQEKEISDTFTHGDKVHTVHVYYIHELS